MSVTQDSRIISAETQSLTCLQGCLYRYNGYTGDPNILRGVVLSLNIFQIMARCSQQLVVMTSTSNVVIVGWSSSLLDDNHYQFS